MRAVLAITINLVLIALLFLYQSHAYAAILLGVSLLTWFFYFLWRRQNLVEQRVTDKIRGQNILMPIEHVMFRARESSGYSQTMEWDLSCLPILFFILNWSCLI